MPRGGRRAGAGAPEGNYNALKHGRRSAQLRQLFLQLPRAGVRAILDRLAAAATLAKAGAIKRRRRPQ